MYGRNSAKTVLEIGELGVRDAGWDLTPKQMNTSWSLVKGEPRSASELFFEDQHVDAVKAMQASPRVPNAENLRQAEVMPERLTKKIEVEGDVSKIPEQVRMFQGFKFREFKISKFGFLSIAKGCEAAASGTDTRRHTDDCRQKLEQLIRDDGCCDAECEKHKNPEELKVDELMGEAEAAGSKVAERLAGK